MELTKLDPTYNPKKVEAQRHVTRKRTTKVVAGVAVAGALFAGGLKHRADVNNEKLPIPAGENVITFRAGADDGGANALASHFVSKDGESRFSRLSDLFAKEADEADINRDGKGQIVNGEIFTVDGDIFEPNPDNPPDYIFEPDPNAPIKGPEPAPDPSTPQ